MHTNTMSVWQVSQGYSGPVPEAGPSQKLSLCWEGPGQWLVIQDGRNEGRSAQEGSGQGSRAREQGACCSLLPSFLCKGQALHFLLSTPSNTTKSEKAGAQLPKHHDPSHKCLFGRAMLHNTRRRFSIKLTPSRLYSHIPTPSRQQPLHLGGF